MTEEMLLALSELGRLLLDARLQAGAVRKRAKLDHLPVADYDVTFDLGVLVERVRQLMAQAER